MKRRSRIEITVETRLMVIRRGTNLTHVWCNGCSSPVQWITPEEAAARAGVSTRTIYCWVEARQLHVIETATQALLIRRRAVADPVEDREDAWCQGVRRLVLG